MIQRRLHEFVKDGPLTLTYSVSQVVAGLLLLGIFAAFEPSHSLAQVAAEGTTDPLNDPSNPFIAEFRRCDADHDGQLTEAEYCHRIGFNIQEMHREFVVFDANRDAKISLAEYLTIPVGQTDEQRGTITDPVIVVSKAKQAELVSFWKKWDVNGDGVISRNEFDASQIVSQVKGLESTRFAEWDLNHDGNVSRDEVARVIDVAFGVCVLDGTMLRTKTGRVVDWVTFLRFKPDAKGKVTRNEYFQAMGQSVPNSDEWFRSIDKNNDGAFDFAEYSTCPHRTDPVATFLDLDRDLDGKVSLAELTFLPDGWRQMGMHGLRGFDDDADGALSLLEYQFMPHNNLLASWSTFVDTNNDGTLDVTEFQFQKGLPLAALTKEYFRRLDVNRDLRLSLDEWPFQTNNSEARFRALDRDFDGSLTEAEFSAEGSLPKERLSRDFQIFDANHDGRMNRSEYLTLPYWIPADERGAVFDPIVALAESHFKELASHWNEWDANGDHLLSTAEFRKGAVGRKIPGLETTVFVQWDLNRDGKVSQDELKLLLEIAFGVRTPEGKLLRQSTGRVVDWRSFRQMKMDQNGFVSRESYDQALGPMSAADKAIWHQGTDQNHDGKFDYDEFALSNHRTDPIGAFMNLDADLNGRLTLNEMQTLSADQLPIVNCLFPGFDDDKDGGLSLQEYQLTPLVNLLASWQSAPDADGDGKLSPAEFRFHPGVALAALSAEYFRRFDQDKDNLLTPNEFPFPNSIWDIHVKYPDNSVKILSVPGYPIICSPEISPDAQWVAVDGWKANESNVAAHSFVVNVTTNEVRDLGVCCMPNWSADGRKIALSKYGGGVFIRDFEGSPANEVSIDRQGWAVQFAPDGLKTGYVKRGNLVVHTVKTGEKRFVFPEGTSPYAYIEHNFTWSPDSERIVFKGHRINGGIDIGIVSTSGDDPKLKIRGNAQYVQSDFSWLAGGKQVMFPFVPSGAQFVQIYELDPDGDGPPVRYPRQPIDKHNGALCWSRDGKIFVYMCKR